MEIRSSESAASARRAVAASSEARAGASGPFEGYALLGWAALAVTAVAVAVVGAEGAGETGLRAAIRATARLSLLLLLPAFVASSAQQLFRAPWSKWMLRNRRYLGLSFAVSQFTHLGFVVALATTANASFLAGLSRPTLIGGSVGYLFLLLLTVTSFDRTTAWLGRRRWRLLHKSGVWLLWTIFAFTYLFAALSGAPTGLFFLPLLAGVALRAGAAIARRRQEPRRSSALQSAE